MSSQLRTLPWVLAIVTVSSIGLSAQAPERLIGTWTINLAKSKYSPADLAPKSGTTRFEAVQGGGGMRLVADGIDWKGRTTHTDYVVKFDGQVVPTNGC